jgi:hypothetical protein
MVMLTF